MQHVIPPKGNRTRIAVRFDQTNVVKILGCEVGKESADFTDMASEISGQTEGREL